MRCCPHPDRRPNLQLVESNLFGLRAACYRLGHATSTVEFVVCPMIHIGTQAYYDSVRAVLDECDEVIFEGLRSFRTRLITASYRWLTHRRRLALVTQSQALRMDQLSARLVHADVSGSEFADDWRQIAWHHRLALLTAAPAYGLWLYLTATRASIGKRQGVDDLRSRNDILRDELVPGFDAAIFDRRDERLIAAIEAARARSGSGRKVAIVYGAAHMRAALEHLMSRHGYRVADSRWLTVMDYDS